MPLVTIKLIEDVSTPAQERKMIRKLTDMIASIEGENSTSSILIEETKSACVNSRRLETATRLLKDRVTSFREPAGKDAQQQTWRISATTRRKAMKANTHQTQHASAGLRALVFVAAFAASGLAVRADDNRAPEVPPEIRVDTTTNKVHFRGHALGFQIYTWNGTSWGNAVPDATLYDDDGNIVATHFGTPNGPGWKSNSGSEVVGKLPPARITVDNSAIQWLRLDALTSHGPGVLEGTTFIHRVHTVGGLAPFEPGTQIGQVAPVPYEADYFFYRHSN